MSLLNMKIKIPLIKAKVFPINKLFNYFSKSSTVHQRLFKAGDDGGAGGGSGGLQGQRDSAFTATQS